MNLINKELEEALLGAILINPSQLGSLVTRADHFAIHQNRWVYEAFWAISDRGDAIDFATVSAELKKQGRQNMDSQLMKLATATASSQNADSYAREVKDLYTKRSLLLGAEKIAKQIDDGLDVNDVIANAIADISGLTPMNYSGRPVVEAAAEVEERVAANIEKRQRGEEVWAGLKTGIGYIDRNFKGLKPSWTVSLFGPPGAGKSYVATQIASVFSRQAPGDYVLLEGTEEGLVMRLMASRIGCDPTDVEFGKISPEQLVSAREQIEKADYNLFYTPRLHIQELRAHIAKQQYLRDIKWAVIDYASLLDTPPFKDKNERDNHLSGELRKIASEYNILLLIIDSVNKNGFAGAVEMSHQSGSGRKSHDADVMIGISSTYVRANSLFPRIDDERSLNVRTWTVVKDRYRGNVGKAFPIELKDGLIDDLIA